MAHVCNGVACYRCVVGMWDAAHQHLASLQTSRVAPWGVDGQPIPRQLAIPISAPALAATACDADDIIIIDDDEEADIDEASISDGENTSTDTLLFSIDEGAGNAAVAANNAIPSIATITEMSASSMRGRPDVGGSACQI